ncbi:MAG: TauD/TfdA family dioxygenase [Parasphingopyxis sp.]|uniref:TauD/TfdA dioxygenase family protein n=1 Tax=Parasphingopyxis sp. TaxID=1920299 RepID=UPI0032EAEBB7
MKIVQLNNAVQVTDIDLEDDEQCTELGRLVAHECVVFVDDKVSEERLHAIHMLWGQPCRAIIHRYVGERKLSGKHWRSLLLNLGHISNAVDGFAEKGGMSRVSPILNEKGKPTGIFTNGKLDWHSDQQSYHESQRVVGLMSLWGSKNSQTVFLCTAPAYEALNHEDKSMVDELHSVWAWDGGELGGDLIDSQKEIIRYNTVPLPEMENPLLDQTATGRKGIRFPSHCFSHFRGMSKKDSLAYRDHLWSLLNKPEYIYTRDWEDGQIVFMDQNITLHARPTDITMTDTRTMNRMNSYMDRLYPDAAPLDHVLYKGEKIDHDTFAALVDEERRKTFYEEQGGHHAKAGIPVNA